MEDTAFHDWLHARHDKKTTPPEVVVAQVEKVVGSKLAHFNRLVIGQENEVYDVLTDDGQAIIVRISHSNDPRFEAERWALDAARAKGVPTPRVFSVEKVPVGDTAVTFCVEEKLPGVPMDRVFARGQRPSRAVQQLGEVMSAIHRVKTEGFGYLQPNGTGWDIPFAHIMLDLIEKEEDVRNAAAHENIAASDITQSLKLLQTHTTLYGWNTPALVHGDWSPAHILVDNDRISGIVDMQECSGNHPVFDFVHWDSHWSQAVYLDELKATYSDKALFDAAFEPLFHLALLRRSLWMLMVYQREDNPQGTDTFKQGIARGLKFFA